MLALWFENESVRIRDDLPVPEPEPGEALIRVVRAGICHTDLELARGYATFTGIPGHEFVGRVEAAPHAEDWVGKRVVGEINLACGSCSTCLAGRPGHCEHREVLGIRGRHGAFAEFLTLPIGNLHSVPDRVCDDVAVFTEPTAAALEIRHQITVGRQDRVLVIGDGKLGNLVAQSLLPTGCDLTVIGRHPRKLALLAARGIQTTLAGDLPKGGADIVVECTGNPAGFTLARRLVRSRGTLVLKSTYRGEIPIDLSQLVVDEITLVGSRCGPFPEALQLLATRTVDPQPLIEECYPLRAATTAFEHARRPQALKILIAP